MSEPLPHDLEARVAALLPALRAYVRVRMGPELRAREESSDIVQSVAREILGHTERFQHGGDSGFRDWLFTTAHRKVVNHLEHWRAQKRSGAREAVLPPELADLGPSPSRHASAREELAAVEAAFDVLTEEQREAVTCSRLLGFTSAEIAQRMGKSEVAVRKILSRGMARLAVALAGDEGKGRQPAE